LRFPGDGIGKEVIPEGCRILYGISATTLDGKVLTPDLGDQTTAPEIGKEISRKIWYPG
jgi:isocitrate/isopropylmalate dehydrogenase